MTALLVEPPANADFEAMVDYLLSLDYRQRREFLWHRVKPRMPRFLYKFRSLDPSNTTSVEHMRDIIVRSRFWLSSPVDFNDPFDMSAQIVVDGTGEEKRQRLDTILKGRGIAWSERQKRLASILSKPDTELQRAAETTYSQSLERVGVCSFGGDPHSILMWSHYSFFHQGVCLQFEVAKDPKTFCQAITVTYSDNYPVIKWTTAAEAGIKAVIETKHRRWKYERETRIIILESSHQYRPFDPQALRGIIIGCRAQPETIQQLRQLLAERSSKGLSLPTLYRAFKHPSKYKLVIKKEP